MRISGYLTLFSLFNLNGQVKEQEGHPEDSSRTGSNTNMDKIIAF
jgi:hypothetical protein